MAQRMLDEIAPLVKADGIDLEDLDESDLDAVNEALARATEPRRGDIVAGTAEVPSAVRGAVAKGVMLGMAYVAAATGEE